jgi:hypothetical protein
MSVYQVASQRDASTIITKHFTPQSVGPEVTARLLAGDTAVEISIIPVAPLDKDDMTRTLKPKAVAP